MQLHQDIDKTMFDLIVYFRNWAYLNKFATFANLTVYSMGMKPYDKRY